MKKYYYYSITSKTTKQQYIGITEDYTKRWNSHRNNLKNNTHCNYKLTTIYKQYGAEDLIFSIIEEKTFDTETEAYNYEFELIQKFDTVNNGLNILQGGILNPMYTKSVYEKMVQTKQSVVSDIYQLKEISFNHFIIIKKWNSKKEPHRLAGYDFRNICTSVLKRTLGDGFYWVEEANLDSFRPSRFPMNPVAELDDNNVIIRVEISPRIIEKENNWAVSAITNAIKRNGKTHNRKFINLSEDQFYEFYPVVIEPVSTIPEA